MTWEYIGCCATGPFVDSTVRSFRGYVQANSQMEAYDKAAQELHRPGGKVAFLNWYVREKEGSQV